MRVTSLGGLTERHFDIPFAAMTFTGNGAMTWTVTAANMPFMRFCRIGKTAFLWFRLINTTLAGVPDVACLMTLPTSIPVSAPIGGLDSFGSPILYGGTPGNVLGTCSVGSSNRILALFLPGLGNFAPSAGATNISGLVIWPLA